MKCKLKIAVIGGGSSYTPEVIEGILNRNEELPVSEIWLVDVEEGREKLRIIEALSKRMVAKRKSDIQIFSTLDRKEAIKDADFVVTQFRVGGLKAREKDELIPLKYNVIGQETTGPGGFAKAMRTIPVILDICKDIEKLSPNAWLINFTNPAGIITEAVIKHCKVKVIGLCNVPIGMIKDISKLLDVDSSRVTADFVGLNHMNYINKVYLDGYDIMDRIIEKYKDKTLKEKIEPISDICWDVDFISALKMIPSPYHRYYYLTKTMLEEEQESVKLEGSRAMQVQSIERDLFKLYENEELDKKPTQLEKRGGAYYSEAAIALISAIYNDKKEIHTVNVKNNGTITNLSEDAVIETNCIIGRYGAKPIHIGKLEASVYGLINKVKAYEQLTIDAAVTGSYHRSLLALISNPLISEFKEAKAILDELIIKHSPYLNYIKREESYHE